MIHNSVQFCSFIIKDTKSLIMGHSNMSGQDILCSFSLENGMEIRINKQFPELIEIMFKSYKSNTFAQWLNVSLPFSLDSWNLVLTRFTSGVIKAVNNIIAPLMIHGDRAIFLDSNFNYVYDGAKLFKDTHIREYSYTERTKSAIPLIMSNLCFNPKGNFCRGHCVKYTKKLDTSNFCKSKGCPHHININLYPFLFGNTDYMHVDISSDCSYYDAGTTYPHKDKVIARCRPQLFTVSGDILLPLTVTKWNTFIENIIKYKISQVDNCMRLIA